MDPIHWFGIYLVFDILFSCGYCAKVLISRYNRARKGK